MVHDYFGLSAEDRANALTAARLSPRRALRCYRIIVGTLGPQLRMKRAHDAIKDIVDMANRLDAPGASDAASHWALKHAKAVTEALRGR